MSIGDAPARKPHRGPRVLLCLLGLLGAWACLAAIRPEALVPLGKPMRFDDFTFTALDASSRGGSAPGSSVYVVRLKVSNLAKRVSYTFSRRDALLVTEDGRSHRPRPLPGGAGDPCSSALPAGTTCTTNLVYDLPHKTTSPRLRLSFGPTGNALEWLLFGRKALQLR